MKKFLLVLLSVNNSTVFAQTYKPAINLSVIKENPITRIENENGSGLCWDYATCGFLEAQILKDTGKAYNLSEEYVAYQILFEKLRNYIAGKANWFFLDGCTYDDVVSVIKRYGI